MPDKPRHPVPDQALIDEVVESLSAVIDERKYAEMLADSIMTPVGNVLDAAKVLAFRDPRLINRSVAAANLLVNQVNSDMRHRVGPDASNKDLARRTEVYKAMVGRERQLLKEVLKGLKAARGILDSSPNPRARASSIALNISGSSVTPRPYFVPL